MPLVPKAGRPCRGLLDSDLAISGQKYIESETELLEGFKIPAPVQNSFFRIETRWQAMLKACARK